MTQQAFIFHILFALFVAGLSALLTSILVRRLRVFDVPNERASHTKITPRGGGLAILLAFLLGITIIHLVGQVVPIQSTYFLGFLFSVIVVAILSFCDDIRSVHVKVKFLVQIGAILVCLYTGIIVDVVHLPVLGAVHLGFGAYLLTFVWILGLTNAYNFIDGLDGLAASTAVIAGLFLSYIAFVHGSRFIYLASLTFAASAAGFLLFNWSPAKIFMGDVGSTFLGFGFAVMAVIAARYDHSHTSFFVVPLLLFHFIFDAVFTFLRRLKAGENVLQPHRSHIYQLLNRIGYNHRQVASLYALAAIGQGVAAVWMVSSLGAERVYVFGLFVMLYWMVARHVITKARCVGINV